MTLSIVPTESNIFGRSLAYQLPGPSILHQESIAGAAAEEVRQEGNIRTEPNQAAARPSGRWVPLTESRIEAIFGTMIPSAVKEDDVQEL